MLLLDTCTLLWLASDPSRLSGTARDLIREHADGLFLSAISGFEIALKTRKGALRLPMEPQRWIALSMRHHGINEVPLTCRICVLAAELPLLHNDLCDRLIVATSQVEGLPLATPDPLIHAYPGIDVRW
jgi:PIN domain nuclease of toxin-antitoxin system